ncbi:hypothetical protein RUND412_001776 [Rhizina undulata]
MFSDSDIKALLRVCAAPQTSSSPPPLPLPPQYFELLSGSGVILERIARDEVEKRIVCNGDHEQTRTSIFRIASDLSLDSRTIERLLPLQREGWGRIGASTIVTTGEYKRLEEALRDSLENAVVLVSDFCRCEEIDLELFRKLLSSAVGEAGWHWIGHDKGWVSSVPFYEAKEQEVERLLEDCSRPIAISELLPHAGLPAPFLLKVVSGLIKSQVLKGTTDGTSYVPDVYIKEKQDLLVEELNRNGVIAAAVLQKAGVDEPEAFVREKAPTARLLDSNFITSDFVAHVESLVIGNVEQSGWSNVKDPDLRLTTADEKALRKVILKDLPELSEVEDRIISKSLESTLVYRALQFSAQQAESLYKRKTKDGNNTAVLKQQDLLKYLTTTNSSIAPTIISSFMNKIYPQASEKFTTHVSGLITADIKAAKQSFVETHYARLLVHHSAMKDIRDPSLKTKLALVLWGYVQESFYGVAIEKLEAALEKDDDFDPRCLQKIKEALKKNPKKPEENLEELFAALTASFEELDMVLPSTDMINAKKSSMLQDMNSKILQKSKDASLLLLLTLVIIHATKRSGVLKISGKYVPKLLRELQKAGDITEAVAETLASVKDAIVAQKDISDEQAASLRRMGEACLYDLAP